MLAMAISDVEILVVRLFTICFYLFVRWQQRLRFKRWGAWGRNPQGRCRWLEVVKSCS